MSQHTSPADYDSLNGCTAVFALLDGSGNSLANSANWNLNSATGILLFNKDAKFSQQFKIKITRGGVDYVSNVFTISTACGNPTLTAIPDLSLVERNVLAYTAYDLTAYF